MKKILALIIILFISVTALSAGSIERINRRIRNTSYFPSAFVKIESDNGTEIMFDINNPNLVLYTSGILTKHAVIMCNNIHITFINMDIDGLIILLDDLSSNRVKRVDNLSIRIVRV